MRTNEAGVEIIKSFEDCVLEAYKPYSHEKMYTIGYGHYGVEAGTVWTKQRAENTLKNDLIKFESYVNKLNRPFNENEFSALVSFAFNAGKGNLERLCRNRTNEQIADAMLKYNRANGIISNGLIRRRKAERELFLKPVEDTLPFKVKTTCDLNIRDGAGVSSKKVRVAKKGEILTVWAILTNGDTKWGKNGNEYFCLTYCDKV